MTLRRRQRRSRIRAGLAPQRLALILRYAEPSRSGKAAVTSYVDRAFLLGAFDNLDAGPVIPRP